MSGAQNRAIASCCVYALKLVLVMGTGPAFRRYLSGSFGVPTICNVGERHVEGAQSEAGVMMDGGRKDLQPLSVGVGDDTRSNDVT